MQGAVAPPPRRLRVVDEVERLWRVRKDSRTMEARLRAPDDAGVELQYLYNGRLVHARRWPARDAAIADANARLRHLLIGGWATHW